ncbi:hypothetical protein HRbin19_01656 [bacterium HR19]|nr:hypothetical protein HRbin19_01656 [bacterium HR19]
MQIRARIVSGDTELSAVIHKVESESKKVVIAFHGFESFRDSPKYIMMGEGFEKAGFNFIRFDFRGCGESEGDKYDLEGRIQDALNVINFAKSEFSDEVYFVGSSLGGTIAILLSEMSKGVVALCPPFVNIGKRKIEESLKKNPPLLIIHGDKDETVPIDEGRKIYDMANRPKEFFVVQGGDHRFSNPEHLKLVIEKTVSFIASISDKNLNK